MEIRKLRKKELKILRNALRYFGSEKFLNTHIFFVVEGERRSLFMCTPEIFNIISELSGKIDFECAGIKIGEIGSRRVRFTIEGAYYLAGNKKKVFINKTAEMLFLYGRDVFASSILGWDVGIRENDMVFVANESGDVLGMGKIKHPPEKIRHLNPEEIVIQNLVDRGEYLRKKRLYDAF